MKRLTLVVVILALAGGLSAAGTGRRSLAEQLAGGLAEGINGLAGWALRYAGGRVADLVDIVEVNVGIGPGLKAGVEYGVLRTTLGYVEAQRIGLDGRQIGTWGEKNAGFGIFPVSLVFAPFELARGAGEPWTSLAIVGFEKGSLGVERTRRTGFATTRRLYSGADMVGPLHQRPGDCFAVGAEAHALLVGARARVKPLEAVDFLLGFFGIDLDPRLAHPEQGGARVR